MNTNNVTDVDHQFTLPIKGKDTLWSLQKVLSNSHIQTKRNAPSFMQLIATIMVTE